ncbi:MAG TPA: peptidoglycan-binding domain-containing protein [Acidimicrobiia bacterium]|nr:peptidoglycan-binding domain-containing protein [Acidimicrobiia bacterium]
MIRRRPTTGAAGETGAAPRRRRRTLAAAGGAALALVAGLAVTGLPGGGAKADDSDGPRLGTAEVTRRTLVEQQDVDGTLGHGDAAPVVNRRNGTLTWLAAAGSTVDRGQPLYEVDGRKVPLLFGDRPAWRTLGPDTSGVDVKQLKQNLVALGYGTASGLGTGDAWTAATTEAVKRWQKAAGLDQDGVVDLGEVVFFPGAVIVSSQSGHLGEDARPGGEVLSATPAAPVVTVKVDASKRNVVAAGDTVDIELPGGKRIPGTVASVGTSAASSGGGGGGGGGGDAEVQVTITPNGSTDGLDGSPVDVYVTRRKAENVLAVPVGALLALAEGGYGVELAGDHTLVAVETGLFADGMVEVRGNGLQPGTKVVVPV